MYVCMYVCNSSGVLFKRRGEMYNSDNSQGVYPLRNCSKTPLRADCYPPISRYNKGAYSIW